MYVNKVVKLLWKNQKNQKNMVKVYEKRVKVRVEIWNFYQVKNLIIMTIKGMEAI